MNSKSKYPGYNYLVNWIESTPHGIPMEKRKRERVLASMRTDGIQNTDANLFVEMVERSYGLAITHFPLMRLSGMKKKETDTALKGISESINKLFNARGLAPVFKVASDNANFKELLNGFKIEELLRELALVCDSAREVVAKKEKLSAPNKHITKTRYWIVGAYMGLWEVTTSKNPTATSGSGFCYVMEEIWEWLREISKNSPEFAISTPSSVLDFRKDVREIKKRLKEQE
ncbi:MAG: hypothetical protein PF795_09685 [Kiritimatiellae bacterium]|jgi:hypothetical protein|nr:hypothetical protein [Kiritimatiellia bacterium]